MGNYWIGIDSGSISIKMAVLDKQGNVLQDYYIRHKGLPIQSLAGFFRSVLNKGIHLDEVNNVSVTGVGGKLIAELLELDFINEIIARAEANSFYYPEIRTVIEIGGEDARFISLRFDPSLGKTTLSDFSMNTICAAGTGSFLDEQSSRLNIPIEEFGKIALQSRNPARIAGRCGVFAKTDMIHLEQRGVPVCDVIAGMCYSLARNFKSVIARGKKFPRPISFQGGVAANIGVVNAFEDVLGFKKGELFIPPHFMTLGAIGAALVGTKREKRRSAFTDLADIERRLKPKGVKRTNLKPLGIDYHIVEDQSISSTSSLNIQHKKDAYLGVDVGSVSTNLAVLNDKGDLLAKKYLRTAGRPIESVMQGLKEIAEEIGDKVIIKGVCTTGSGRYMIGDIIGADIVKNEITTQARAAIEIDRTVDTIFEIGGQDSKYICINNGVITDFEMNKVCAAGTGSFLEEQAKKLNLDIKNGEFDQCAFEAKNPVSLGERCTVFMGSDVGHYLVQGVNRCDVAAGLCYSVVQNYLHRVVHKKKIGNKIFFQGGVAFNKSVCSAFEKVLGKTIIVPPDHEMTGAIGCALIAKENAKNGKSKFKGFDLVKKEYKIESFICTDCPNQCEISKVFVGEGKPLSYGSKCGKYDVQEKDTGIDIPDLFAEREESLFNLCLHSKNRSSKSTPKVGIPRSMMAFYDFFPFWQTFFTELGFDVVLSDRTNRIIIQQGLENSTAEFCFPMKLLHGHVLNLIEKGVDYIFFPSIIDLPDKYQENIPAVNCLYIQVIPYIIKSMNNFREINIKILQPILEYRKGKTHIEKVLIKMCKEFHKNRNDIKKAFQTASKSQEKFLTALRSRGEELLSNLKENQQVIVIIGRTYNIYDNFINLGILERLRERNVIPIPMDYLSLASIDITDEWGQVYWEIGRTILRTAKFIVRNEKLQALYLTNFGCNPDSVLLQFFNKAMSGKPYLEIETDEHGADVGVITRIEAFLDSLSHSKSEQWIKKSEYTLKKKSGPELVDHSWPRTIYVSNMSDTVSVVVSALRAVGIKAEFLPEPDKENIFWGKQFCSGKECFACNLMMSEIIKKTQSKEFDPLKSAFCTFGILGPCIALHGSLLGKIFLNELGYSDIPVFTKFGGGGFRDIRIKDNKKYNHLVFKGFVAVDVLIKALHETRPYEQKKGETDKIYKKCLENVLEAIEKDADIIDVMKKARELFEKIPVDHSREKSLIGLLGDVYVRTNRFANNNLVRRLESLGVEVWMCPMFEWSYYTMFHFFNYLLNNKKYSLYLRKLIDFKREEFSVRRIMNTFKGYLRNYDQFGMEKIKKNCAPYIDMYSIKTEVPMDIGKTIDYITKGVDGIVSPMSFTCASGNTIDAILKRVKQDYDNFPCLVIPFDGLEVTNIQTRLEAFVSQVKKNKKRSYGDDSY